MKRLAHRQIGWEDCFAEALRRARTETLVLGSFDCAIFASRCVNAITGVDLMAEFRGTYQTQDEAIDLMVEAGGMQALVDRVCVAAGLIPISPRFAQRGDVVLLPGHGRWPGVLGIVVGALVAAPANDGGLAFCKRSAAIAAWHIRHSSCRSS